MDKEKRMKVLVVEQDPGSRLAYTAIARSGGWRVLACDHTADVPALIRLHGIGALISDHARQFGFSTLRKIREAGLHVPAIIITANHFDRGEARDLDVHTVLGKPPEVTELRAVLEEVATTAAIDSDFAVIFGFMERTAPKPSTMRQKIRSSDEHASSRCPACGIARRPREATVSAV